jgi:hypothetical protein
VTLIEDEYVNIEVAPGFNGSIPFSRMVPRQMIPDLRKGDILFLALDRRRSKIEIVRRIESHRERLKVETHPTVLARLWGSRAFRDQRLQRHLPLLANIVGFPQLKAQTVVRAEQQYGTGLLPRTVRFERQESDFIDLADRIGPGVRIGRLTVGPAPRLLHRGGSTELTWSDTMMRFECHDILREAVAKWRWRDFANVEQDLDRATVVAVEHNDRTSLVRSAIRPFPVDHLIEQFGIDRESETLVFTVAGSDPGRVILEVAPGRYVELPATMIESLSRLELAEGRSFDWSWLSAGDRLHLSLRPSRNHPYLPNVVVRRVEASTLRHLRKGAFGRVHREAMHVIFGAAGASLHVDDLGASLQDVPLDLHAIPPGQRLETLSQAARSEGSRLVLSGTIVPMLAAREETRIDIGIAIHDPAFVDPVAVAGRLETSEPAKVAVRVYQLDVRDGVVRDFRYRIEQPGAAEALVRITGRDLAQHRGAPLSGDHVLVYATAERGLRVWGLEEFAIEWTPDPADGFSLHRLEDRKAVFARLLAEPAALVWMTVEGFSPSQSVIRLSRRKQLEAVAAHQGRVVRSVVRGSIDPHRVVVEVAGIPVAMHAKDLCLGISDAVEYGEFLAGNEHRSQIDVVVGPGASLSATQVHLPVTSPEFMATIDFVASDGLICIHAGMTLFVPISELAWCDLSPEAMKSIFRRGQQIRLRWIGSADSPRFSHGKTTEHLRAAKLLSERMERSRPHVDELPQDEEPLFVRRQFVQMEEKYAVVSVSSGMLIAVRFESERDLDDQVAYLEEVDLRRCRVTATTSKVVRQKWRFSERQAPIPIEEQLKAARLDAIELMLPSRPAKDAHAFFAALSYPATPRSLRVMLELTHASSRRVTIGNLSPQTPFGVAWARICGVLDGGTPTDALTAFGAGYWLLISGDARAALPSLERAAAELASSFDVQLSLARARFEDGQGIAATQLLRTTCRRLLTLAHRTLQPPLLTIVTGPHAEAVAKATQRCSVQALERVFKEADRQQPSTAEARARQIWINIASSPELPADFDRSVKDFLEALADEEDLGLTTPPALYSLAAQLSFACGDTPRGRSYLARTFNSATDALELERSWAACLRNVPALRGNAVIEAIGVVMGELAWRRIVDEQAFLRLWTTFRSSMFEWSIASTEYRVVSPPSSTNTSVVRWAVQARAMSALPFLLNSFATDLEQQPPPRIARSESAVVGSAPRQPLS